MKQKFLLFTLIFLAFGCSLNNGKKTEKNENERLNSNTVDHQPVSRLTETPKDSLYKEIEFTDYGCYVFGDKYFEKNLKLKGENIKLSIEAICTDYDIYDTMPYSRGGIQGARVEKFKDNYALVKISGEKRSRKIKIDKNTFRDSIQKTGLIPNGQFEFPFEIVSISENNSIIMISNIHYPFTDAGIRVHFELKENDEIKILRTEEFYEY